MSRETPNELVLCVSAAEVKALFDVHGAGDFLPASAIPDFGEWLGQCAEFIRRPRAEDDERWRHLATYTILRSRGQVFSYERGRSGSEDRLHGRRSIGIGGHVTLDSDLVQGDDGRPDWMETLATAAVREVREEVDEMDALSHHCRFVGLIVSDATDVDRVHLGYVASWDCLDWGEDDPDPVVPREDCLADPRWLTVAELRELDGELESWSRIALTHVLAPPLAPPRPAPAGEAS